MEFLHRINDRIAVVLRGGGTPALLSGGEGRGPDFICVGAEKAGTRWLFDQLNHHPDFWMPPVKELHYFDGVSARRLKKWRKLRSRRASEHKLRSLDDRDRDFVNALTWLQGRELDLGQYAQLFNPKGERLSGDITPGYSLLPEELISEIVARFPRAKIVYLAREPISRVWSQYSMWVRHRNETSPKSVKTLNRFLRTRSAIGHSMIAENVARWRNAAASENFGLFFFDDLIADPVSLRNRILEFIGGDAAKTSGDLPADFNGKAVKGKVVMSERARARLIEIFGGQIRACSAELGGRASDWPRIYGL